MTTTDQRLLIPATPVLLDEWCGPAVFRFNDVDAHVTICAFTAKTGMVGFAYQRNRLMEGQHASIEYFLLNLSRSECRDRLTRMVAVQLDLVPDQRFFHYRTGCWRFEWGYSFCADRSPEDWHTPFTVDLIVPALADLDPDDPTLLPDGSRLVDALALAAVWAGVSP